MSRETNLNDLNWKYSTLWINSKLIITVKLAQILNGNFFSSFPTCKRYYRYYITFSQIYKHIETVVLYSACTAHVYVNCQSRLEVSNGHGSINSDMHFSLITDWGETWSCCQALGDQYGMSLTVKSPTSEPSQNVARILHIDKPFP